MTVVIYDGPDFEKASHNVLPGGCILIYPWYSGGQKWKCVSGAGVYCWRLKQHNIDWGSRHSLILQLFGITRSARVNGLIYHHGVLPVEKVRDMHRNSPLASAYLEYTLCRDLNAAAVYWNGQTGVWLYDFDSPDYTAWIRMSTGGLCVDVGATSPTPLLLTAHALDTAVADSLLVACGAAGFETVLLAGMALDDIHTILCYSTIRECDVSLWTGEVALGSLWKAKSDSDFASGVRHLIRSVQLNQAQNVQKWWLPQANNVFKTVGYPVLGDYIQSFIRRDHYNMPSQTKTHGTHRSRGTSRARPAPQRGLLLVARSPRPESSQLRRARDLGMPHVFMQARVGGSAWSRADYELRQFHFAKGFNPASPEIAHRLGYPPAHTDGLGRLVFRGIKGTVLHSVRETLKTYPAGDTGAQCLRCDRIDALSFRIQARPRYHARPAPIHWDLGNEKLRCQHLDEMYIQGLRRCSSTHEGWIDTAIACGGSLNGSVEHIAPETAFPRPPIPKKPPAERAQDASRYHGIKFVGFPRAEITKYIRGSLTVRAAKPGRLHF
ncbi:hypothetical protein B0H10DRAFT_2368620 [Mycena sp. CBHHK59/15]|nr:hypothetical protein B0H10DRAFT_2368620 [Mycena sp. CBHHK59/15]